jgi:hypothetical protein
MDYKYLNGVPVQGTSVVNDGMEVVIYFMYGVWLGGLVTVEKKELWLAGTCL